MLTRSYHMACALFFVSFATLFVFCTYRDHGFCATFVDVIFAILFMCMALEHDAERMAIRDQQAEDAQ